MPATGPVYQPTTVSYDRPSLSHATASSTMKILRRPMPQICVLILALMSIAAGKRGSPKECYYPRILCTSSVLDMN